MLYLCSVMSLSDFDMGYGGFRRRGKFSTLLLLEVFV